MSGGPFPYTGTGILGSYPDTGTGILGNFGATPSTGVGLLDGLHRVFTENGGMMTGMGFGLLSGDYSTAMRGALAGMEQDEALRQRKFKEAETERRRVELKQAAEREGFDPAVATDPDLFRAMYLDKHKRREPNEFVRLTQGLPTAEVERARRVK
ncbi:hypothetical protein P7L87_25125, partial [Vibrio parahaemolyticus]|nr:hypothetical protein [Vibrio parahaemolyticus]